MKKKLIFLTLLSYLTQSYCAQIPLITNLESKIAALEKVKNNIDQTKELAQQILDRKIMPLVTLILNGDKNPDYRKQIKQWRLLKYMLEFHALALEQKHLLTNNTNALNTLRTTMLELETEHIKDKNRQWSHFVQRAALNQKVFKIIEQEIKKNLYTAPDKPQKHPIKSIFKILEQMNLHAPKSSFPLTRDLQKPNILANKKLNWSQKNIIKRMIFFLEEDLKTDINHITESDKKSRQNFIKKLQETNGLCLGFSILWGYSMYIQDTPITSSKNIRDDAVQFKTTLELLLSFEDINNITIEEKREIERFITQVMYYQDNILDEGIRSEQSTFIKKIDPSGENIIDVFKQKKEISITTLITSLKKLLNPQHIIIINEYNNNWGHAFSVYKNREKELYFYDSNNSIGPKKLHSIEDVATNIWDHCNDKSKKKLIEIQVIAFEQDVDDYFEIPTYNLSDTPKSYHPYLEEKLNKNIDNAPIEELINYKAYSKFSLLAQLSPTERKVFDKKIKERIRIFMQTKRLDILNKALRDKKPTNDIAEKELKQLGY